MTKFSKITLPILIILFIGLIGLMAYPVLFGDKNALNTNVNNSNIGQNNANFSLNNGNISQNNINIANINDSNVNNQSNTNGSTIDTSNWKTYRNEELGFEVKYPEDLKNQGKENDRIYFYDDKTINTLHLEVLHNALDINNMKDIFNNTIKQENIDTVSVSGLQFYRFNDGDMGCGGYDYRTVLKDNNTLRLYFVSCNENVFKNEFEILSSLKILK